MKQVISRYWWPISILVAVGVGSVGCGQSPPRESDLETLGTTEQALNGYGYGDNRAWSQSPPNGLSVSQVPQFVQIGFDDNYISGLGTTNGGMTWALNLLRNKRNPAGSGQAATFDNALIRVNFYSNTCYIAGTCGSPDTSTTNIKESWHTAVVDGHETGSHTHTHPHGAGFTVAQWNAEIDPNVDWLTRPYVANALPGPGSGPGLANANLEGFRAPFLEFNATLFSELKNNGFTYDISIEEGWQLSADGLNYNWPFTLNSGSPSFATGNVTGLWELGAAPFLRPSCSPYPCSPVSTASRTTGLDYNMYYAASMTKQQALDSLKYTLDQRLAGNRAPFFVGAHTPLYSEQNTPNAPNTTAQERREVMEEFITYALTKPQVRFATAKNIITWMRNPVALGGGCTDTQTDAQFCSTNAKNCGSFTGTNMCGNQRTAQCGTTCSTGQTCGGNGTANVCATPVMTNDRTEGGTGTGTGTACNTTNEPVTKAYDNLMSTGTLNTNWTKWCITSAPSTGTPIRTMYDFSGTTSFAINKYTITTANDSPARDPKDWTLQGCNTGCTLTGTTGWTQVDSRSGQFANAIRFQTNTYTFTNATAYQFYRFNFTANNGDASRLQLSEIQMFGNAGGCTDTQTDAQFCATNAKNCGSFTGNNMCGASRTANCGTCTSPATCGGGGTPNVCGGGCTDTQTDVQFCATNAKNCGSFTGNNMCGASRTANCGTCTSPATCGGGGTANVCGGGGGNCGAPAWSASATYVNGSIVTNNCTVVFLACSAAEVGHSFAWRCDGADPNWCKQFQPGSGDNYNGIWTQLEQCN